MLVAALCAALVGMQIYLKRAVQGSYKASADSIGEQFSSACSNYNYTTTVKSKRKETITPQGKMESKLLEPEIVYRSPFVDDFSNKKLTEEKLFE